MKSGKKLSLLVLFLVLNPAAFAAENEPAEPTATPFRPSVSSPAALSEPGWLDMELGWQRNKGGGDNVRQSMPVAAKLAFNKDWGVVLNSELAVRRTDVNDTLFTGAGDITLQLKHRIATASEDTTWGVVAGVKLPSAKDSIGSGKSDALLTGIFSKDFAGDNHLDANLGVTRLGAYGVDEGRSQYGWAAALAHSLNEQWSIFAEPSGAYRRGAASTGQLMGGTSYNFSKRVVFDFAVARGVTPATPDWQVLAGVTLLVGRLW